MKGFDIMKSFKDYKIFLSATEKTIKDKALLRVDLYDDMKIKDISELKGFNIFYISKGHEDLIRIDNIDIPRKVRYIKIFKK